MPSLGGVQLLLFSIKLDGFKPINYYKEWGNNDENFKNKI
jgi:hypothetical protein